MELFDQVLYCDFHELLFKQTHVTREGTIVGEKVR